MQFEIDILAERRPENSNDPQQKQTHNRCGKEERLSSQQDDRSPADRGHLP